MAVVFTIYLPTLENSGCKLSSVEQKPEGDIAEEEPKVPV